jgi:hypothetical protein
MMAVGWMARLNQFAWRGAATERCDLCGTALPAQHAHLVEPASHRLLCACGACALLFEPTAAARFRRVPGYAALLDELALSDTDWDALGVPVDIAFFFDSSVEHRPVGLYPGAAGVVRASINADSWERLKRSQPVLAALSPDVEALLVNRLNGARECYRMPIDRCYALAGLIRQHWRGLSGGTEVWQEVQRYFQQLRRELAPRVAHA